MLRAMMTKTEILNAMRYIVPVEKSHYLDEDTCDTVLFDAILSLMAPKSDVEFWPCFSYDTLPNSITYEGKQVIIFDYHAIDFFIDFLMCFENKMPLELLICRYMSEIEERRGNKDVSEFYSKHFIKLRNEGYEIEYSGDYYENSLICMSFFFVHELVHNNTHISLTPEFVNIKSDMLSFFQEHSEDFSINAALVEESYCDALSIILLESAKITSIFTRIYNRSEEYVASYYYMAVLGGLYYRFLQNVFNIDAMSNKDISFDVCDSFFERLQALGALFRTLKVQRSYSIDFEMLRNKNSILLEVFQKTIRFMHQDICVLLDKELPYDTVVTTLKRGETFKISITDDNGLVMDDIVFSLQGEYSNGTQIDNKTGLLIIGTLEESSYVTVEVLSATSGEKESFTIAIENPHKT